MIKSCDQLITKGHTVIPYSKNFWQRKSLVNLANHLWFTKFAIQILIISCDIYTESKQAGICQSFLPPKIHAIYTMHPNVLALYSGS